MPSTQNPSSGGITIINGGAVELVARHVAVADETDFTFSGLDGDTDEVYILSWHLVKAKTNNTEIDLQPNGSGADLHWSGLACINGAAPVGDGVLTRWALNFNNSGNAGDPMCGTLKFFAKRIAGSIDRLCQIDSMDHEAAAGDLLEKFMGRWNDTVTNLTSLKILSSVALGIKAGSVITLYKQASG